MTSLDERVRELLGQSPGARWEPDPGLLRVVHDLDRRGFRAVGLIPAADDVDVRATALRLAFTRAHVSGGLSGLIDVRGAWMRDVALEPGSRALAAVRISEKVALVTRRTPVGKSLLSDLRAFLRDPDLRLDGVVVDLAGFHGAGEHLEATALLDAVSVVVRAGRTRLVDLDRRMLDVSADKNAGVLLLE
jgi:hypothetical protein